MSETENISNDKKDIPKILPLLPVRDVVIFPSMVLPLSVGREKSVRALEEAMTSERYIFVATQKNLQIEDSILFQDWQLVAIRADTREH